MPSLPDHPRHPFSRSQSALATSSPQLTSHATMRRPSVTTSPPSVSSNHPGATPHHNQSYNHTPNQSYHLPATPISNRPIRRPSQQSISVSPPRGPANGLPPVPRNPFARPRAPSSATNSPQSAQADGSPSSGAVYDKEPKTPAEYALHAVFTRFVTAAEMKIEGFVKIGGVSFLFH